MYMKETADFTHPTFETKLKIVSISTRDNPLKKGVDCDFREDVGGRGNHHL